MTAKKINVTPAPGLLVLDPSTGQPLPSAEKRPQGTRVELTSYWHKRVACGDVTEVPPPSAEKTEDSPDGSASAAAGSASEDTASEPTSSAPEDPQPEQPEEAPARKPFKKDK